MSPLPATFTPGLPPDGATSAFIGQDAQGSLYLLRWHETNGWEALGWIGAGKAAMPALRHPAGDQQGLIVGHSAAASPSPEALPASGVDSVLPEIAALLRVTIQSFDNGGESMRSLRSLAVETAWHLIQGDDPRFEAANRECDADQWAFVRKMRLVDRAALASAPAPRDTVLRLRQQLEMRLQTAVANADATGVPIDQLLATATVGVSYADLAALISGGDQ